MNHFAILKEINAVLRPCYGHPRLPLRNDGEDITNEIANVLSSFYANAPFKYTQFVIIIVIGPILYA